MKNKFFAIMVAMFTVATISFVGCSGSADLDDFPVGNSKKEEEVSITTKTSNLKTYVYSGNYIEVAKSVLDCITNKTSTLDQSVKTVFIPATDSFVSGISDSDLDTLAKIYANNGNIVVVEPTVGIWNKFVGKLFKRYSDLVNNAEIEFSPVLNAYVRTTNEMIANLEGSDEFYTHAVIFGDVGEEHNDEHFYDMIILRENDVHVVADINDADITEIPTNVEYVTYDVDEETGESKNRSEPVKEPAEPEKIDGKELLEEHYRDIVNSVITTLNKQVDYAQSQGRFLSRTAVRAGGGYSDIKDITAVQEYSKDLLFNTVSSGADTRGNQLPVTVKHEVWPLHDFDNNVDYYVVRQTIVSRNVKLGCSSEEEDKWLKEKVEFGKKKDWKSYGPYMKNIRSALFIEGKNKENVTITSYTPTTTLVDGSYTSGFTFNIGASLSGTGGGGGGGGGGAPAPAASILYALNDADRARLILGLGLNVGAAWSETKTITIKNMTVLVDSEKDKINWIFSGSRPEGYGVLSMYHTLASPTQKHDCTVENFWVWKVPKPEGKYTLKAKVCVEPEYLLSRSSGFMALSHTDAYYSMEDYKEITLEMTPPARAEQKWTFVCTAKDENGNVISSSGVEDFVAKNYTKKQFSICTNKKDDREEIKKYVSRIQADMKNTKADWITEGYNKSYTFEFKTGNNYETLYNEATFTFDPKK